MTLRDFFAAKAMQGWFASETATGTLNPGVTFEENQASMCALFYGWADAMLAARSQP
jgi:hypothetical protein